jgi:hypothetical protein
MKEYHYTYKISFPTGHVYFGVRSCKCLPEEDTYMGSPSTFKHYWKDHEPSKTILACWPTREIAEAIEDELILYQWSLDRNLSLNATVNGTKFNRCGVKHSDETRLKMSGPYVLVSPEGIVYEGNNLTEFCRNINISPSHFPQIARGHRLHYKGWTCSIEAHRLYTKFYPDRGIRKREKDWGVRWIQDGTRKSKYFKVKEEAIKLRDNLEKEGYEFAIKVPNWKEKLDDQEDK